MDAKFIDYCLKSGLFPQDTLKSALVGSDPSASIYKLLVQHQLVTQDQLAVAAGEFYQCPVVDISRVTPDSKALNYGSAYICNKLNFLPFAIDPVAGLLVALADYTQIDAISAFLKDSRVERMKFYIAPCETLQKNILAAYGKPSAIDMSRACKRPSILRTQFMDGDNSSTSKLEEQLSKMVADIAAAREENLQLRFQIEQLSATVELEANLLRELAKILKSSGVMDTQSFERWLLSQR